MKYYKHLLSLLFIFPFFFFLAGSASANFSDSFTAADGRDIHAYNSIYTYDNTPVTIQNNSISPNHSQVTIANNNFTDGCMSMDWTGAPNNTGMTIRDSGSGFYGFNAGITSWELKGFYNSSNHVIASGNTDFTSTHTFKLCAIGTQISVYKDGTQLASGTDSGVTGSGDQTIYGEGNTVLDNLSLETDSGALPIVGTITVTPTPVQVNSATTFSASFTDSDTADTHTLVWDWGDGSTTNGTFTESNGSGSVSDSHTYAAPGIYPVTLTVQDQVGATGRGAVTVNVGNPSANFSDSFTAADGRDIHAYSSIYVVNGNPVSIQNNAVAPDHGNVAIYGHNFTDGCMSMDWTGNSTNTNMNIRFSGNDFNQSFYSLFQAGGGFALQGFYDNTSHAIAGGNMDFSGTHTYKLCAVGSTISAYKDGTQFASGTDTGVTGGGRQNFYSEGNTLDNLSITPNTNSTPAVQMPGNSTLDEGASYSAGGSFTDSDSSSWSATVNYGDGSGTQSLSLSGTNFSLSHAYQDNGTYTVTVNVTDNQGATGTGTVQVTVNNVAPTVGTITAPSMQQINTSFTASASFTDLGALDTHIASWNWGDGNSTTGTVTESNGSGSVSNSHTYSSTGVYTITLTVTDKDSGVGTSTFNYVAVYDSNSSFAGGNKFSNPSSANPNTSGNIKFGITAKYNNSNVLTGNAKMDFKNANIDFVSTSLTSLATSNGRGYLRGTGTVNGSGTYDFLATGIDGSVVGGSDFIRFQIKTHATGAVIYDSQPGAGDTTDPTTTVTTGNVRVQ